MSNGTIDASLMYSFSTSSQFQLVCVIPYDLMISLSRTVFRACLLTDIR